MGPVSCLAQCETCTKDPDSSKPLNLRVVDQGFIMIQLSLKFFSFTKKKKKSLNFAHAEVSIDLSVSHLPMIIYPFKDEDLISYRDQKQSGTSLI